MSARLALSLAIFVWVQGAVSQVVVPATPKKFVPRAIGGGATGGVEVIPRDGRATGMVRYTTRIVLAPSRMWTSTEGKQIDGRLIAFEDVVVEAPEGAGIPAPPPAPESPTVVRDGKIRLLVKDKPVEVPINRFSPGDLDFVERIRKAHAKKETPEP